MPAKSKAQQRAAGMALAVIRSEAKKSSLKGAALEMYGSMTEQEIREIAHTKIADLPDKVESS